MTTSSAIVAAGGQEVQEFQRRPIPYNAASGPCGFTEVDPLTARLTGERPTPTRVTVWAVGTALVHNTETIMPGGFGLAELLLVVIVILVLALVICL